MCISPVSKKGTLGTTVHLFHALQFTHRLRWTYFTEAVHPQFISEEQFSQSLFHRSSLPTVYFTGAVYPQLISEEEQFYTQSLPRAQLLLGSWRVAGGAQQLPCEQALLTPYS